MKRAQGLQSCAVKKQGPSSTQPQRRGRVGRGELRDLRLPAPSSPPLQFSGAPGLEEGATAVVRAGAAASSWGPGRPRPGRPFSKDLQARLWEGPSHPWAPCAPLTLGETPNARAHPSEQHFSAAASGQPRRDPTGWGAPSSQGTENTANKTRNSKNQSLWFRNRRKLHTTNAILGEQRTRPGESAGPPCPPRPRRKLSRFLV